MNDNDRKAAAAFLRAQQKHLASLAPEQRAAECLRRLVGAELPKGLPVRLRRQWNAALLEWSAANAANAAECAAATDRLSTDWEQQHGRPYPKTLDDWTLLAAFAGVPAGDLLRGDWTAAAVEPIIRGVLLRLKADQRATDREAADPLELVERKTIAERFDVVPCTVDRWRKSKWFPEPTDREAKPLLFKWAEVVAAVLKHEGRAPKIA